MTDPDRIEKAVASLNDVVAELVCGLATGERVTKGWAYTAVTTLAEHTRSLGMEPLIDEGAVAGWEPEQ